MEQNQFQIISVAEPALPLMAAPVTEEQKKYNPVLDPDAPELPLEVILQRAGVEQYATAVSSVHGIETAREFSELQEANLKLFCRYRAVPIF